MNKETQILSEITTYMKYAKYNPEQKRREIRNWDLWGPFFFCLILAS